MKFGPESPDDCTMRLWFRSMSMLLGVDPAPDRSVRELLCTAELRSASIGISLVDGVAPPAPLTGHIVAVEESAILISRPADEHGRRELLVGERLRLSIAADKGFDHGDVEVLGRWSTGEGSRQRFGYRVSMPSILFHEERRSLHRVPVAFDLAPTVLLLRPISLATVGEGTVIDLSEGGVCIRARCATVVRSGESLLVRAEFPEALPPMRTRMEAVHSAPSRVRGHQEIGLRFLEVQEELGRALRALELRRHNRLGAAA